MSHLRPNFIHSPNSSFTLFLSLEEESILVFKLFPSSSLRRMGFEPCWLLVGGYRDSTYLCSTIAAV